MAETLAKTEETEAPVAPTPEEEEEGETETGGEPVEPAEPEPEHAARVVTEQEWEKRFDKARGAAQTHRRRLDSIFEEDALSLVPCPFCPEETPGFLFPFHMEDETRRAMLAAVGAGDVPEMLQEPGIEVCDVCNGHGNTLTGSMVLDKRTKLCGKCNGNGFTDPAARTAWTTMHPPVQPAVQVQSATPVYVGATVSLPATDLQGRPREAEFYGRDSAYMTPEERARDPWSPKG